MVMTRNPARRRAGNSLQATGLTVGHGNPISLPNPGIVDWMKSAACAQTDPDAFFPEKGQNAGDAKMVCSRCEVRAECLELALATAEPHGIWGGLSERERRLLLAQ